MKTLPAVSLVLLLGASLVFAGERSSTSYTITPDAVDAGGQRLTGGVYTVDASIGMIGGLGSATGAMAKTGYAGQLYDVNGLVLAAAPTTVNEGATRDITPAASLDDSTLLLVPPSTVTWSVTNGPLSSVSIAGLATAANVYQNTAATVRGDYRGFFGTLELTVLNVGLDDFGTYAADQIDDAWQVQHFGENNPLAAPTQDPDGDGQNNRFEFIAGVVPTDVNSRFTLRIEPVTAQPNQVKLIFNPVLAGRTYAPVFRVDLASGNWDPLTTTTQSDAGDERTLTDLAATGARKFYRIDITKP